MRRIIALIALLPCGLLIAADQTAEARKANEAVKFSLSAGVMYTDNRDALEVKASDTDLFISPRLSLDMKWDEVSLLILYAPTYRYRSNPSIIDNDSQLLHDFSMNLILQPTRRTAIRLKEDFNLTDDPSVQQDGATLRRDSSFIYNQTEVGMNHQFSELSNIDLFGRYMLRRYDDTEVRQVSDVTKTDAGITYWKQPAKKLALVGLANVGRYDYSEYLGVDRAFNSMVLGLGVEQELSSYVKYGLRGGLQSLQYSDSSIGSSSSPYAALTLQVFTVPSTRILASISHQVRDSAIFPFASQTATDYGLGLNWESPSSAFLVGLSLAYRVSDYSSDDIPDNAASAAASNGTMSQYMSAAGINSSGQEKTIGVSVDIGWKIGNATVIKLVQSYEDVRSGVRWSYDRMATTVAVTQEF